MKGGDAEDVDVLDGGARKKRSKKSSSKKMKREMPEWMRKARELIAVVKKQMPSLADGPAMNVAANNLIKSCDGDVKAAIKKFEANSKKFMDDYNDANKKMAAKRAAKKAAKSS